MSDPRTLHRQWTMLRFIPRHPRLITATELTNRLLELGYSVNKRTVERDLKMLESLFGIRVDDRSRPHGWCWEANSPGLNVRAIGDEEALMLSLAENIVKPVLPSSVASELSPLFLAARKRLKETIGPRRLKAWEGKVTFDQPSQPLLPASVQSEVRNQVVRALLRDQWLHVNYNKRGTADALDIDVQPLGLVARGPMLYLVCNIRGRDGLRTIALSRIRQAKILDEQFRVPTGFSLRKFVEEGQLGFGGSRIEDIQLRVSGTLAQQLAETPLAVDQKVAGEPNGTVLVDVRIPVTPQFKRWVLSHGDDVEVIRPRSLRQTIIRVIQGLSARYSEC